MKIFIMFISVVLASQASLAKIVSQKVDYKDGETALEGFIVYDTSFTKGKKKLPGIVVVHDWMGVGTYVKMRAEQLAELGYVAFVADIYGKGVRPKDPKEAGGVAGKFYEGDRKLMRSRADAAFQEIKKSAFVDSQRLSAMGYCFGGSVSLEMARMGLPLKGVLSFHGKLSTPNPQDAKNIQAAVLVMHGAIDPNVPASEVTTFQKEMEDAHVDYQFIAYGGAVHSFTEKHAGNDPAKGAAYDAKADARSFLAMENFLKDVNTK